MFDSEEDNDKKDPPLRRQLINTPTKATPKKSTQKKPTTKKSNKKK